MVNLKQLGQSLSQKAISTLGAGVAAGAMMLGVTGFAQSASAVTIAGIELSDNGFANVISSSGLEGISGFATGFSVSGVLNDQNTHTYAQVPLSSTSGSVTLGFSNLVFNGSGADIALFELDSFEDGFNVTIGGITNYVASSFTGFFDPILGQEINVAQIDLSNFGITAGSTISQIEVALGPDVDSVFSKLALAGSITQSTPEPSAMLGLLATAGLFAYQRKSKSAKKA